LLLIARTSAENLDNLSKSVRIDEVIWQVRDEIKKYNGNYHVNINIGESLTEIDQMIVKGDEYLLKTAVSNIVDNACKYSDNHTVNITLKNSDSSIILIFEDSGIGISEQEISKIFDPFYRGSNVITYPGSGIGLQLVNQIIQNHRGKIYVSSKINQGTTFTISLPSVA
jgi:signal transduction histidine kinase